MATSKLAINFIFIPLPKAPKSKWALENPSKTGTNRRMSALGPLAYTVRSLRLACAPVPDNGQSSKTTPLLATLARAASLSRGSRVLVSMTSKPLEPAVAKISAFSFKAVAFGKEQMTTCTDATSSAALRQGLPPAAFNCCRAFAVGSNPET